MAIYKCPHCGAPFLTPQEAATHCDRFTHADRGNTGRECPRCGGSRKVYDFFGNEKACPTCGGRGTV